MIRVCSLILLTGLLAVPAAAQEKFTIKLKKDAKGDVVKCTKNQTETGKSSFSFMGQAKSKDDDKTRSSIYKEVVVEKQPGKRATKIERTYEKAELTKNGKKVTPAFFGKPILIERNAAGYKFTIDGKELTGDDAEYLADEFSKSKSERDEDAIEGFFVPKQAVAVNDSWKLDLDGISKGLGEDAKMSFDVAKSTGTGKLTKAYKKDGIQFGVLEIEMDLALTKLGEGDRVVQMEAGSRIKATIQLDVCIDGSLDSGKMDSKMEMTMKGGLKAHDGGLIKIEGMFKQHEIKQQEDLTGKK